jgi:hypothetical protein
MRHNRKYYTAKYVLTKHQDESHGSNVVAVGRMAPRPGDVHRSDCAAD